MRRKQKHEVVLKRMYLKMDSDIIFQDDPDMPIIGVNRYTTAITEELKGSMPPELYGDLIDIMSSIHLVQALSKKNRKRAKDLPKDSTGRIEIDLENPHILEGMDYFRQAALHFEEHGKYTYHFPSKSKTSPYYQFWQQEVERCKYGLIRPEDGEWITGYHYFYLNYSRIDKTVVLDASIRDTNADAIRAERVEGFPNFWDGDYLFFHYIEKAERQGKYANLLKTRGRGFSFKMGAMLARNTLLYKKSKNYAMASETEYLTKDGILNKCYRDLDFCAESTPWPKLRITDQGMHKVLGYRNTETGVLSGMQSEVIGVTTKDNPDRARGKRGKLIIFEESGKYPKLDKVWSIARPSMEQGSHVFGMMVAGGTGGTTGADFSTALRFFYSPIGYRILHTKNVYDKTRGNGVCSFFFPEYLNREECYDKDGNSDVVKALVEVLHKRYEVKYGSDDPMALTQEKADRPITPQEAVMRTEGSLFPIQKIKDHLSQIQPNLADFVSGHYVGRIVRDSLGQPEWKVDANLQPIRNFPLAKDEKVFGAIEIYEMPKKAAGQSKPPIWRYIAGIDPVDDDYVVQSSSLVSIFVFDTFTDKIVAEFTGRPNLAEEFYDICIDLLEFYNAIANYENDKKGLYTHFYNKKKLHLLCDTPKILRDMNMISAVGRGNKSKGTGSSKRINQFGRRLQRDWMLKESVGNPDIQNLYTIRSVAYLKEAEQWNPDGNFDRVSAMGMVMILRENIQLQLDYQNSDDFSDDNLSEDPFWGKNYAPYDAYQAKFAAEGIDQRLVDALVSEQQKKQVQDKLNENFNL